jgi:hypothetical protein
MSDVMNLLEKKVSELGGVLERMRQSPMDYNSDGFYDFFFSSEGFVTRTLEDEDEPIPLVLKLHLCIFVDEDTGVIGRRMNFVETDKEHEFLNGFDVRGVLETFSDYGKLAGVSALLIDRANAFLEDFRLKTGVVFDLMPTMPDSHGTLYSSVNAVFFTPVE